MLLRIRRGGEDFMIDESRKKLIVSADDFGMNEKANENILQLVRLGKIDRVSVLIEGILKEDEILEILESGVKIDLHLSLEKMEKLNGKKNKRKNVFRRVLKFVSEYFSGNFGKLRVWKDWNGQVLLFEKIFARLPDGINSHEHLHFFPPYFRIISRLARKHQIKYLRFGSSGIIRSRKADSLAAFILDRLWKMNSRYFKRNRVFTSDFLLSFDWIKKPSEFLDLISDEVKVELVFHPERSKENSFILRNL